jgi:hypothetical protein
MSMLVTVSYTTISTSQWSVCVWAVGRVSRQQLCAPSRQDLLGCTNCPPAASLKLRFPCSPLPDPAI